MPDSPPHWVKASLSSTINACLEVADDGDVVRVRNSRHPATELTCTRLEFAAFLDGAKRGEFDFLIRRRG